MTRRIPHETLASPKCRRSEGHAWGRDPLSPRRLNGPSITEREIEMNRNSGVGIIGVIVIVVVILFIAGVIKL